MNAPTRKPGRPRDPLREARRKEEILACAAAQFAQAGYATTDVGDIADAVGVGKGTIYRYFPTKQELFLAAVDAGLRELADALNAKLLDESLPPLEAFAQTVRAYLAFFHRRPDMVELFIQERAAFRDRHTPLYFAPRDDCDAAGFAAELIASGHVRPMPVEQFLDVVGNVLYGTIMTNHLAGKCPDPEAQAAALLDVVLHGVLAPAKPKRKPKEQV